MALPRMFCGGKLGLYLTPFISRDMKRYLSTFLIALIGTSYAWASSTRDEERAAGMYMASRHFPVVFEACGLAFPSKAEQYKRALDDWLSSNRSSISSGEAVLVKHAKIEGVSFDDYFAQKTQDLKNELAALDTDQLQARCDFMLEVALKQAVY